MEHSITPSAPTWQVACLCADLLRHILQVKERPAAGGAGHVLRLGVAHAAALHAKPADKTTGSGDDTTSKHVRQGLLLQVQPRVIT